MLLFPLYNYVVSLYCISALYSAAKAAGILGIYHLSCFLIVYMINKAMIIFILKNGKSSSLIFGKQKVYQTIIICNTKQFCTL